MTAIAMSDSIPQQQMIDAARQIGAERLASREAYIIQYLEKTGARIQDLELVQYEKWDGEIYHSIYFLRPRGTI